MPSTSVLREQFARSGKEIVHRPTGAKFYIGDTTAHFLWTHWGLAGAMLPNGNDYDRGEIERVALEILREDATQSL